MRIRNIIEGIRMGSSDLSRPAKKDYTIGFEFEIAVEGIENELDYDDAYESFYDNYDPSEYAEEWFNQNVTIDLLKFIQENDIEPRFGMTTDLETIREFEQTQRDSVNSYMDFTSDQVQQIKDTLEKDSNSKLSEDLVKVILKYKMYDKGLPVSDETIEQNYNKLWDQPKPNEIIKNWAQDLFSYYYLDDDNLSDAIVYTNEGKDEGIPIEDISDVSELYDYFDIDQSDLYGLLSEDDSFMDDLHDTITSLWEYEDQGNYDSTNSIEAVKEVLNDELGIRASDSGDTSSWAVVPDGTSGVDAEIISPVMNISQGIESMYSILNLIEENPNFTTSNATGLHINVGTWSGDTYNTIDWLKFLVILEPSRVLNQFFRGDNYFAQDKLQTIISCLEDMEMRSDYTEALTRINNTVINNSPKYSAVNFSKLQRLGYIELRAPGNTGYSTRGDEIEALIRKTVRALELASDPNALRQQYLKRLYKLINKPTDNVKVNDLTQFINQCSDCSSAHFAENPLRLMSMFLHKLLSGGTSMSFPSGTSVDKVLATFTKPVYVDFLNQVKQYLKSSPDPEATLSDIESGLIAIEDYYLERGMPKNRKIDGIRMVFNRAKELVSNMNQTENARS